MYRINAEVVNQPLTKEELAIWLAALRGGQYEQGHGALGYNSATGYCCMGVLNKVLDLHVSGHSGYLVDDCGDAFKLPHNLQAQLAVLNDGNKWTFDQIADWIEANVIIG